MTAVRKVLIKVFLPISVLIAIFMSLAWLPERFPDHGVVSAAIYEGNLDRVRELLDRGADPNSRRATLSTLSKFLGKTSYTSHNLLDFSERTPLLIEALNRQEVAIAQLLIERGADPNARDAEGQSALDRARDMELPLMVKLLQENGAH